MLRLPMPRAICANRYISSVVAIGDVRKPVLAAPCAAAAFCKPSAAAVRRDFPIHDLEFAIDPQHGLGHALRRINALETEAIAIGDPGFIDLLVLTRHHFA